jgi:hypothetical protein
VCDFVPAWRVSTIPDVGLRCTDVKNVEKVIKKNQASQLPRDHISDSLPGVGDQSHPVNFGAKTYLSTVITASNP